MTREDLKGFIHRNQWLDIMLDLYEERRTKIEKVTSVIDGMPKAKNKPNYKKEALIDSCDKMLDVLYKEQERLNEVVLVIMELPDTYKILLTDMYIKGKTLEQTAEHIGYVYDNTSRKHGIALNMFDEKAKSRQ